MSFDFNIFKEKAAIRYLKQYENCFLSWFVGFSEGDGSFVVDNKNKRTFFIINQKDPKVLFYIKENLGFGRVKGPYYQKISEKKVSEYYRYIISDKESCYFLSLLFKENLVLNKTNKRFILWEENINFIKTINENKSQRINQSLQQNSWLSGFIDAEACFSASSVKSIDSFRIKFSIGQTGERALLLKIKKDLNAGYIESKNLFNDIYIISSLLSVSVIIQYLIKYPLHSNKNLSFVKWCKLIRRLKDDKQDSRKFGTRAYARMTKLGKAINKF